MGHKVPDYGIKMFKYPLVHLKIFPFLNELPFQFHVDIYCSVNITKLGNTIEIKYLYSPVY